VVRNLTQVRVTPTGQAVGMSILWRLEIHGADFAWPRTGRQLTPTDLPGGGSHTLTTVPLAVTTKTRTDVTLTRQYVTVAIR
jgi:hypothetical protein